ncbi:VOC family protein [Mumia quercus]|uniref:VOC family protein n=1 Tax=Mumia quercus TaxID=2976125 RepID=UPI0021D0AB34|nr:VOC family protein [Mumia quercus]
MSSTQAIRPTPLQQLSTGHVGLSVTSLDRSRDFYVAVLGLDVMGEGGENSRKFAFLGREGRLLVTLWEQADAAFDGTRAGLHHLSFQVETIEEVEAVEATVKDLGATLSYDGVVPHGEGLQSGGIFFEDPDGTRLEVYAPTGASGAAPHADAPTCGFF